MKTKRLRSSLGRAGLAGVACLWFLAAPAHGQTANTWQVNGSGKWEIATNWSAGSPSSNQKVSITNATIKTVTIDATTVLSNAINGCLTITNLQISLGNGLSLNNSGTNMPLRILNSCTITASGAVNVTNGAIRVDGQYMDVIALNIGSGVIMATNAWLRLGRMTTSNSTVTARYIEIDSGTLTVAGGTITGMLGLGMGSWPSGTGTVWVTGGTVSVPGGISIGVNSVGQMTLSNGTVRAGGMTVGFSSPYPYGFASSGTFTIAGGSVLVQGSSFYVAWGTGSRGTVWVKGGQLVLTNADDMVVGYDGPGRMTVTNASVLASDMSIGNGTLTIQSGGLVAGMGLLVIGGSTGPTGVVEIAGGQLVITNQPGSVGAGSGLVVDYSVTVNNTGLLIMTNPSKTCVIGNTGAGSLTVAGGTVKLSAPLVLGAGGPAFGRVWVTGGQLVSTNGSTWIGEMGTGYMAVFGGTTSTTMLRDVYIGHLAGSQGILSVLAGSVLTSSNLIVGTSSCSASGTVQVAGGNLIVSNAAHNATLEVQSGTLTVSSGSLIADRLVMTNPCAHFARSGGTILATTVVLNLARDDDVDGLPNGWEQSYGFDPLDSSDATKDSDADGKSNLQEYLTGTNPTNNASVFRIVEIEPWDEDMLVTWTCVGAKKYALQTAVVAGSGGTNSFLDLQPIVIAPGVGESTLSVIHLGGATNVPGRIYRVRFVP